MPRPGSPESSRLGSSASPSAARRRRPAMAPASIGLRLSSVVAPTLVAPSGTVPAHSRAYIAPPRVSGWAAWRSCVSARRVGSSAGTLAAEPAHDARARARRVHAPRARAAMTLPQACACIRTTHYALRATRYAHRHGSRRGSRRPSFSAMPLGVSAIDANALGGRLAELGGPMGRQHQVSVGDAHAGAGAEADASSSPRAHGGVHDGWPPPVDTTGDTPGGAAAALPSPGPPLALAHASLGRGAGLLSTPTTMV